MYYQDNRGGCFELVLIAAMLSLFAILALRVILGLVPHGFW